MARGDQEYTRLLRKVSRIEHLLYHVLYLGDHIMSAISDFAARQTAFNDRMDTAVAGVQADIEGLKALIEQLQNTPGGITPEDQDLLNLIEARAGAIADKLDALDALTPPVVPA